MVALRTFVERGTRYRGMFWLMSDHEITRNKHTSASIY